MRAYDESKVDIRNVKTRSTGNRIDMERIRSTSSVTLSNYSNVPAWEIKERCWDNLNHQTLQEFVDKKKCTRFGHRISRKQ